MKLESFALALALLGLGSLVANLVADPLDQWTLRNSGTSSALLGITYGNSRFAAVGSGGTFLTSPDGVDWDSLAFGAGDQFVAITYGNKQFMAVGGDRIFTSPDGSSWRHRAFGRSGTNDYDFGAVACGDNEFAVSGSHRPLTH